jgi:GAF domain-containing protein
MKPPLHPQEERRVRALRRLGILDSPREAIFDSLAEVVAALCEVPIATIGFVDSHRHWLKSAVGVNFTEIPIDISLSAHAISQPGPMIVPDLRRDVRFADNPMVTGSPFIRFYAAAVLEDEDGLPLGTLCALDLRERHLTGAQLEGLQTIAHHVSRLIRRRRTQLTWSVLRKLAGNSMASYTPTSGRALTQFAAAPTPAERTASATANLRQPEDVILDRG